MDMMNKYRIREIYGLLYVCMLQSSMGHALEHSHKFIANSFSSYIHRVERIDPRGIPENDRILDTP